MEDKDSEEKKSSSVDKANNLFSKARSGYSNYKRIRRGYSILKAGQAAAGASEVAGEGAAVVAGGASLGTGAIVVLLILIIIILIAAIFMLIFGGVQNTEAGNLQTCESSGGTCLSSCQSPNVADSSDTSCTTGLQCCMPPAPPPSNGSICSDTSPSNPAGALKRDFNVVVSGTSNTSQLTTIYKIFCSTNSTHYQSLLKTGGNTLTIRVTSCSSHCISVTNAYQITLNGFFTRGLPYSSQRYLLLHESGHVITARNPRVMQAFPLSSLKTNDAGCYDYSATSCASSGYRAGYFLRSYPLRYYCKGTCWTGITASHESFAEALADTLSYNQYNPGYGSFYCAYGLPTFPTKCGDTYSWMKNNVLD